MIDLENAPLSIEQVIESPAEMLFLWRREEWFGEC
jgi:hypothetical protein